MIGATPNTEWTNGVGVDLDDEGFIRLPHGLGEDMNRKGTSTFTTETSIPGMFAAGEVTDRIYKQAITASAAGAQAAIDAERWLRERRGVVVREPRQKLSSKSQPTAKSLFEEEEENTANKKQDDDTCDLTTQDCINSIVQKYPVVVFSKPWCPYCRKAMEALKLAGVADPHVIDLSQHKNAPQIQATLQTMTGRRTVPNVFVGGKSIGGGDETAALQRTGKLVSVLQEAGALTSTTTNVEEERKVKEVDDAAADSTGGEPCDLLSVECFKEIVQKYPVLMFSLSWCPECKHSLEVLTSLGIQPHIIDLDDYKPISQDIRHHMLEMTGRRSVPNLFVGGEYIGGFRQMTEMHGRGELVPKFQKVGVSVRTS